MAVEPDSIDAPPDDQLSQIHINSTLKFETVDNENQLI